MNHGLKLHPDGTLELTMPKDKKITRVLICEAGTQNGSLYCSDGLMEQYKWERDTAISQLKDLGYKLGERSRKSDVPDTNVGEMVSISAVVDMAGKSEWFESSDAYNDFVWAINALPSTEPKIKCVAKVTLSQEQIQDAIDKAVEKMKAELEPCDFCKHKDDCGDMALYCPSERRTYE